MIRKGSIMTDFTIEEYKLSETTIRWKVSRKSAGFYGDFDSLESAIKNLPHYQNVTVTIKRL